MPRMLVPLYVLGGIMMNGRHQIAASFMIMGVAALLTNSTQPANADHKSRQQVRCARRSPIVKPQCTASSGFSSAVARKDMRRQDQLQRFPMVPFELTVVAKPKQLTTQCQITVSVKNVSEK